MSWPARGALVAVVVLFALVTIGAPARSQVDRDRCLQVPRALASSLRHGLRPSAHARIVAAAAVRGRGQFRSIFASGAYFVSADVTRSRIATWAVTPAAFRTGSGAVFGVGPTARKVSRFGSLASPELVASWGISTRTSGYAASRRCVAP